MRNHGLGRILARILLAATLGFSSPAASSAVAASSMNTPAIWRDSVQGQVGKAMAAGYLEAKFEGTQLVKGPLYTLGGIWIRSAPGFTTAQMGIALFSGQPANSGNLQAIGNRVKRFLLDHGHPFAVVNMDFTTRESKAALDLGILIDAGEGFKFGGFKYGGSSIRPVPLERLALLKYGEPYSETRVALALEKLSRTGYFESVFPGTVYRDSSKNMLYPSLSLTDLKGNRLSGILGYDSEKKGGDGVNGYVDIHLINLRGTARDLDFNFESKQTGLGTSSKEARLAYLEPWIPGTPIGVKVDLHVSLEDSIYDERSLGAEFFQDLDFHSRYLVTFARQFNHDYLGLSRSTADIAGLGLQYDSRDQAPATLKGIRFSTRLNGVHRDLQDSAYFLVQNLNELALWANRGRWVGHALISGSGNWPLAGRANRGELYAIGGANTIRGFREKEFLTNLFLYGNLEIQFLLAPRSRASAFLVPAWINRMHGDVNWKREIGYGLGLESGAKDWTFGISYALNPRRTLGNGFVHIRVTNNF